MTWKSLTSFFCPCRDNKKECRFMLEQKEENSLPLSQTCCLGRLKVCRINGDRKLCARMADLGLLPGSEVELICPTNGHRCMIRLNGGTISLDEPSAQNILVTPL